MDQVRVLVVDDSASMRRLLRGIIESAEDLTVVGTARNGEEAVAKVKELEPDVVTLDINMPVMDGLTALGYIMIERPTPTVVISSLTREGTITTLQALELGAVDFVAKPSGTISPDIETLSEEIVAKVRIAARSHLRRRRRPLPARPGGHLPSLTPHSLSPFEARVIVAIGVSTGGPRTLLDILPQLPPDFPSPIAIVQHMPPRFTAAFAQRLDEQCAVTVKEAHHHEPLQPGHVYIAPGGHHMRVAWSTLRGEPVIHLSDTPRDTLFRPSVDVLFESVANLYGRHAVGVLLTGMGTDGAEGMVRIRQAGGITIAESEETAVVFGMPRAAIERGGADIIAPSTIISKEIARAIEIISSPSRSGVRRATPNGPNLHYESFRPSPFGDA
jgi:two-component system chemotaxis response regulator CheB